MGIYELYKKWTPDERKQAMAGMNALRFLELRSEMLRAGCTAPQMLRAGFTAPQMLDAGFTAPQMLRAGFTAPQMLDAGCTAPQMLRAGFTAPQMLRAGFTAPQMLRAGFTAPQMLRAGCTAPQMLRAGFTAPQMLDAGFTADSLAEMESEPQKDIQKKAAKMGRIESEYVVEILEKGLMDGSKYGTLESCGCFIGSAAKRAGETAEEYCRKRGIEKSSGSPAERWFMSVLVGDTPENNYAAKRGVEWIKEAIAGMAV